MWTSARQYVNVRPIDACPFVIQRSYFARAFKQGLFGALACAVNVLVTLPAYNLLDRTVQTGGSLSQSFQSLRKAGPARLYGGLLLSIVIAPTVRFGDTFAHSVAAELFGVKTVVGILLTAVLVCLLYPIWRVLVYLIAFPDKAGLRVKKGEEPPLIPKIANVVLSTVMAAFPFWVSIDGITLVASHFDAARWVYPVVVQAFAGALAGTMSCLSSINGTGLKLRLPLCAFEGMMFVVQWKALCKLYPTMVD